MKNKISKSVRTSALLIAVVICFTFYSCTDESGAIKALERSGYKPIEVGGYGWFSGSESDVFVTKFKAVSPNGETVTGCVTKGWFKGNTIRVDD